MRINLNSVLLQLPLFIYRITILLLTIGLIASCNSGKEIQDNAHLKHFYQDIRHLIYTNPDSLKVLSDSLIGMAQAVGDSDFRITGTILKANCYSFLSDYEKSIEIFNSIDSVELHRSSPRVIAKYYGDIAHIYKDRGEKDKAIQSFQNALDIGYEINDTLTIASNNSNIGTTLFVHGHYEYSMNYLFEALKHVEKLDNPRYTSIVLSTMAGAYSSMKDFHKAIETSDRVIAMLKSEPQNALLVALNNKGSALIQLERYTEAEEVLNQSLEFGNEIKDSFSLSYTKASLAEVKFKQSKYKEAKTLAQENLKFELAKSLKTEASDSYLRLANIYKEQGELYKANINFDNAIQYAKMAESVEDQYKAIKGKYECNLERSANPDLFVTYKKLSSLNDSLYTKEIAGAVKNAEFAFETEKKEAEIHRLSSESDLKSNILSWQKWTILGLILSTVLSAFLFQVNRRKKLIQEQLNLALQDQNQSLVFEKHELEELNEQLRIDNQSLELDIKNNSPTIIEIAKRGKKHQVNTDNIKYIVSEDKGSRFYLKDGSEIWDDSTLKNWIVKLPANIFPQIHKSFVVNRTCISWINYSKLSLYDGIELPIGRVYKKNLE